MKLLRRSRLGAWIPASVQTVYNSRVFASPVPQAFFAFGFGFMGCQ